MMPMIHRFFVLGLVMASTGLASAQYVQLEVPVTEFPTEHAYQRGLRDYLGTLTEADLTVDLNKKFTVAPPASDIEDQYRLWLLTLHAPHVESAAIPAKAFTLKAIEGRKSLNLPTAPNSCQALAWLASWNYPGNPYHGSAELKRRAFVVAAIDLACLDYLHEHGPASAARSDFLGGNLIWIGYTYKNVKDVIPPAARTAMEAGLKKLVLRLDRWGPKGSMTDMDLFAPVGLSYIAAAINDPEIRQVAEAYSRRLFTDKRFFHPAGYFVDVGCFDTSYNGISIYFATWTSLATDWKFAKEAVDKAHRLRAHLCLPDPDGVAFGPSHMSSRTSADSPHDQWNFAHRPYAAALVTDEALHLARLPTSEELKSSGERLVFSFTNQMKVPVAPAQTWRESHWGNHLNFAHEHYVRGHYTRRLQLEKENSQLLKPCYARKENFVREFGDCFVIARFDRYSAVVHTGPIRGWPNGLGGGMLSAFWTPEAGAALLGRRKGMQGPTKDAREEWTTWPVNAITGTRPDGRVFSSADVPQPQVRSEVKDNRAVVVVEGAIPLGDGKAGPAYRRQFTLEPSGLKIASTLKLDGSVKPAELTETIPIFLNDSGRVAGTKAKIEWQIGDRWVDAEPRSTEGVKAVRVTRYAGKVLIVFDRPRRLRLSPKDWVDGYQSRATCRTLLVDLLEGTAGKDGERSIQYTLTNGS